MIYPQRQQGFTLIELIVVMLVMSILAGTIVPLAMASVRAERVDRVQAELGEIATALDAYYFDQGTFPSALNAADFLGVYLMSGIDDARVRDEWGGSAFYRSQSQSSPDQWTIWSVGENGVNDGAISEDFVVTVQGRRSGDRRTRQRLRIIAAALADYLGSGGNLTGNWATDRAAMGLATSYALDGYGTPFQVDAATLKISSAGADRAFSTADDLTI